MEKQMQSYQHNAIDSTRIAAKPGLLLLDFGTDWCSHCVKTRPLTEATLRDFPDLPHIMVEDGPGRALGRQFHVKLWPTLILLHDGMEVARLVRPTTDAMIHGMINMVMGAISELADDGKLIHPPVNHQTGT